MSKLVKPAQAGTVESCDIMITVAPAAPGTGITIELVSPTIHQYGKQIKDIINRTLTAHGVEDAIVHANDKGALDYTIEARVKAAIMRALS